MADDNDSDNGNEVDQDAMAAEWEAMAGDGDGGDGAVDQDAMAAEWEAMAEGGGEIDNDAMAAEWEAMADDGGEVKFATDASGERVLSQDEIDSLLGFSLENDEGTQSGVRAIINSALVSYERLPMLEVVFDRLVRLMTTNLRNFTSDNVEVSLDNISSIRFGDYLNSIPLPAILAVFRAQELDNYGLFTVDSNLIYSIVDVLLGGRRGTAAMRIEGRPYTTIERSLIERMTEVILANLQSAFEPIKPIQFELDRMETNPLFAAIARPSNAAILVKFRIDMEDRGGRLELMLPYATLEPVRKLLLQQFMGEKFGRDSIWEQHLATELWQTHVDLEAVLDEQVVTLGQVMNLQVGQTLMLNASPESIVDLRCGGVSLMTGNIGRITNSVAIRVNKAVKERPVTVEK